MSEFNKSGQVSQISKKEWYDSKKGVNIDLFSFKINTEDSWFRTGTNPPPFNRGDNIQFVCNEKKNVNLNSVQRGESGEVTPPPTQQAATGGQTRDGYWAQKEQNDKEKDARYQNQDIPRMSFSASQDRAVNLVSAALAAGALSFGNAAKGKQLDMLLGFVDQVTDRFVAQAMTSPAHVEGLVSGLDQAPAAQEEAAEEEYSYD